MRPCPGFGGEGRIPYSLPSSAVRQDTRGPLARKRGIMLRLARAERRFASFSLHGQRISPVGLAPTWPTHTHTQKQVKEMKDKKKRDRTTVHGDVRVRDPRLEPLAGTVSSSYELVDVFVPARRVGFALAAGSSLEGPFILRACDGEIHSDSHAFL